MQQALDYATTLNIPFVFSSNGDGFVFHDRTGLSSEKEASLTLDRFPSPRQLWDNCGKWCITPDEEEVILQDYFDDGSAAAGVSDTIIDQLLGHSRRDVLRFYTARVPEYLRDAINLLHQLRTPRQDRCRQLRKSERLGSSAKMNQLY